jgi:hypothetical protein
MFVYSKEPQQSAHSSSAIFTELSEIKTAKNTESFSEKFLSQAAEVRVASIAPEGKMKGK